MTMTPEQVHQIARLARLEISTEYATRLAPEMDAILEFMETLNELDTQSVAPLYSPLEEPGPLRPDEVKSSVSRAEMLRNAPDHTEEYIRVPRIV